jgi:hypothetical protein
VSTDELEHFISQCRLFLERQVGDMQLSFWRRVLRRHNVEIRRHLSYEFRRGHQPGKNACLTGKGFVTIGISFCAWFIAGEDDVRYRLAACRWVSDYRAHPSYTSTSTGIPTAVSIGV